MFRSNLSGTCSSDNAAQAEANRSRRTRIERLLIIVVTLVGFLAAWEIAGRMTNPLFFAPVSDVLREFWNELLDPRARLLNGFLETLSVFVPGFIIASVLGMALGVLMGRSNIAFQILDPYVTILYNTPRVALIPILLLWMGVGDLLKIYHRRTGGHLSGFREHDGRRARCQRPIHRAGALDERHRTAVALESHPASDISIHRGWPQARVWAEHSRRSSSPNSSSRYPGWEESCTLPPAPIRWPRCSDRSSSLQRWGF